VLAVVDGDPAYADELLRSLDAFLEHNGHWERAAAQLFCTDTPCAPGCGASRS
jgi:hypothetical protein